MRPLHCLAVPVLVTLGALASTQTASCDPELVRLATRGNGYRQWGDRCEGMYRLPVGGTTLYLASFTEAFEDYNPRIPDTLLVEWAAPGVSDLEIRAEILKNGPYYRMDTRRPPGTGSYRWSTAILVAEQIRRRDLGVVGRTRDTVAGSPVDVYVPLRIRQKSQPLHCGTYQFVLWPGEQLREVYVSLAPVRAEGGHGEFVREDLPLGFGPYPAGSPIRWTLKQSDVGAPGLYYLRLRATLDRGGSTTRHHWIYLSSSASQCG